MFSDSAPSMDGVTMRCSCIIVNYCEPIRTYEHAVFLASLDEVARVVVVDNCSPDGSWDMFQSLEWRDGIVLIRSNVNGGYGAGNNLGIRYCLDHPLEENLQLVVVVNPDATIDGPALSECMQCFALHERAIVAAPVECRSEGKWHEEAAWEVPSALVYSLQFLFLTRKVIRIHAYRDSELADRFSKVGCVSGALLMIDAEKFERIGLYDEGVFLFCEETSLGVRAKNRYDTFLCTGVVYMHESSTSMRKSLSSYRKRMGIVSKSRLRVLEADYRVRGLMKLFARICYGVSLLEAWPLALISAVLNR